MTTKNQFSALDALIDHLRLKGVVAFKGLMPGGEFVVELALLPNAPEKPFVEPKKTVDEILEPKKRGADGRTAEEQVDLYNVVLDAEE